MNKENNAPMQETSALDLAVYEPAYIQLAEYSETACQFGIRQPYDRLPSSRSCAGIPGQSMTAKAPSTSFRSDRDTVRDGVFR